MHIRSPIVAVLGHVDHGKTSLLDAIRGTGVAKSEAGGITQMIGASYVPRENIESVSKGLAERMKINLVIPGILFIDTPGHEAFTNLRERGGSIADIAVLVVDVVQGIQPQTLESISILRNAKTPFVIAANKIDLVNGWKAQKTGSFLESLSKQSPQAQENLDQKLYGLMGKFSERGFDSERFDRVTDFTKQVAIIPVSAKTREGLAELLLLISGMSQRFLEKELHIHEDESGKGSIIEVKEVKGLGPTVDVIMYDGIIREGDEVVFFARGGAMRAKVRALLLPSIHGSHEKFRHITHVVAAAGVKISSPDLLNVVNGSPIIVMRNFEKDKQSIESQMKSIIFENPNLGVVVKADSLGSVEALLKLLAAAGVPVKSADVGAVTKSEVQLASMVGAEDHYLGVVLAFNVAVLPEERAAAEAAGVTILSSNIIYHLLEHYAEWKVEEKEREKRDVLGKMAWPCAIKFLPGCSFRISKPAIFGVEVLAGKLKPHVRLMSRKGALLGEVKVIQKDREPVPELAKGGQAAISVEGMVLGKDAREGDIMLTYMTKDEVEKWREKADSLSEDEKRVFAQIEELVMVLI